MKLIKPYYTIETPIDGEEILIAIEKAARTCYKSEDKIDILEVPYTDGVHQIYVGKYRKGVSARPLVEKLLNLKHEAMIEFGGMITVKFVCDRGVSHELVRHRLCSFAQESTRYCNYGKSEDITYIIPNWLNIEEGIYDWHPDYPELYNKDTNTFIKPFTTADTNVKDEEVRERNTILNFLHALAMTEEHYMGLMHESNWTPQQARAVLPNALKTEINLSANIREWRHIFQQRVAKTAHPQMRELMQPLLDEFKSKIPIIFDDITY